MANKQLKYLMAFIKAVLRDIGDKGVDEYLAQAGRTAHFTRENLLFLVVSTGYSCLISMGMGADVSLVRQAGSLARNLQLAIEHGFGGKEAESSGRPQETNDWSEKPPKFRHPSGK